MTDQTILEVGASKPFATIGAAISAANAMGGNADIRITAGTYVNDGGYLQYGINNVTIEGVGGTAVIVDPAFYAGGKAAIVVGGQNIVLRNLDISGVAVPDANGAAVRYDGGTLLLDHVHFHDNQNGFLGAPDATGTITIQDSEFDRNGTSAGNTHNIYVGDVAQFTLLRSYVHDANVGHEVKSRAENNTIVGNYILDNGGTSSYSIDLPNGGNAVITGNVIQQGANNGNHTVNAYGEEGNLHAGTSVTFSGNVVINDDPNGAGPLWNSGGRPIGGSGNSVWNLGNLGSGMSAGSVTVLPDRPTIDLSVLYAAQAAARPASSGAPSPGVPSAPAPAPIIPIVATPTAPGVALPTYRFFDSMHGTQFLTTSVAEANALLASNPAYTFEGFGMNAVVMNPADPNVATVFRFFNMMDGTHFFTTSTTERDTILSTRSDLVGEQANFAEHLRPESGDTAVFRFFDTHAGTHFFTQSASEHASIVATRPDLVSEGVAFYAPGSV